MLAYIVRQCTVCHLVMRLPIVSMFDALMDFPHCGRPSDHIEIVSTRERPDTCEVKE